MYNLKLVLNTDSLRLMAASQLRFQEALRSMDDEITLINEEMAEVRRILSSVVGLISSFDITNRELLPYGLKAHTRSVSWIVEQVITQQTKYRAEKLGLSEVDIDLPDTCLHDCVIKRENSKFFVNVKIHNMDGRASKNDISAVEKLYMQYRENSDYRLIYATFGVRFQNINISFDKEAVHVFSPQFLPIYVNPRNDKIQAFYHHTPQHRSREDFLKALRDNSKSIVLN